MIVVRLPLPPSVSRRWTVSRRTGQLVMQPEARAWKKAAQWDVASQYRGSPLTGRVRVTATVCEDASAPGRKRDIENYMKLTLDSLSGRVYVDDSQIDVLLVTRGDPVARGAITLEVSEL